VVVDTGARLGFKIEMLCESDFCETSTHWQQKRISFFANGRESHSPGRSARVMNVAI
jgi:hypothetical protein